MQPIDGCSNMDVLTAPVSVDTGGGAMVFLSHQTIFFISETKQ